MDRRHPGRSSITPSLYLVGLRSGADRKLSVKPAFVVTHSIVGLFGLLIFGNQAALITVRSINIDVQPYFGGWVVLFILLLVWAADVGAYFAGVRYGRNKMMPAVSPGKTMEGLCGGISLAFVVMMVVSHWTKIPADQFTGYYLTGLFTVVASVFGDLNESMFKRSAGVKDSGSILPGHGSILDQLIA